MEILKLGIDIGSTTAKVVVLNENNEIVFSDYRRHQTETIKTLCAILRDTQRALGDVEMSVTITGSAGMGISESHKIPFMQEVVSSAEVVRVLYPEARTLIDIGGEDAKMIFFDRDGNPDIRMNGSCAGGTGSFIDEMASLMNVSVADLDKMAENHTRIHPIASRCGVFAKTDLQNLLSREVPREDIAASVFNAIVLQTLATLSRGKDPRPKLIFSGGPLTFLNSLKAAFIRMLAVRRDEILCAENTELFPALGAALVENKSRKTVSLSRTINALSRPPVIMQENNNRLQPLFKGEDTFESWVKNRKDHHTPRIPIQQLAGKRCFLGVDSGSTTTKLVLIDGKGRIGFDHYCNNKGNSLKAVQDGLDLIRRAFAGIEPAPLIAKGVVTGYGEDLIRSAFGFDEGIVETLAHYRAAKTLDEDVSFILDIGGQDMKAIFVNNGHIQNIEINEACSSGCGSFIENFSNSMGYPVQTFAEMACQATAPCDLGTRCTVFMNSKVKQSLREGAEISDISAGLAYSVIKNALHKVLKITNTNILGERIVVQGGTFRNPAILKAIEILLEKEVLCPDIAELMGAYGAALKARDSYLSNGRGNTAFVGLEALEEVGTYTTRYIRCHGCENKCAITKLVFPNKNVFFTGNRCERIYSNSGKRKRLGMNLAAIKADLLFDRDMFPDEQPIMKVGLPRALNMFENFPFWNTLFVESGIAVQLSEESSQSIYEKGAGTIMSENICYPAKLIHGHILQLIESGVDRIFYPMVFYEYSNFSDASNCYVCPIVSGYPDVIRSAIGPEERYGVPLDSPTFNFQEPALLKKSCFQYLKSFGVPSRKYKQAFEKALIAQEQYRNAVQEAGREILETARAEKHNVVLVLGRPYHIDPQINHKVYDILAQFGVDVITEDGVPRAQTQILDNSYAVTQWEYTNRIYHAAQWAAKQENVEVVQLNSFGCGPDAFAVDEVKTILQEYGKGHTVIRVDDIVSPGSIRLRLRSLIEKMNQSEKLEQNGRIPRTTTRPFQLSDRGKKLVAPQFADFCTAPVMRPAMDLGYPITPLPPSDRKSVALGLKYANNEICYPGTIVVGDVIKALQSETYNPSEVVITLWETGGQCRASCIFTACKKAMVSAGFEDVPLVTVSTQVNSMNEQPDFNMDIKRYIHDGVLGVIYTDAIASMYYRSVVREIQAGEAKRIADHYIGFIKDGSLKLRPKAICEMLEKAVAEFNQVETRELDLPMIAVVGEIYVKYNEFSNHGVASWLMEQGFEVMQPPLLEFFCGWFVSIKEHIRLNLRKPDLLSIFSGWLYKYMNSILKKVDRIMRRYRYYIPPHSIFEISRHAEKVVSLTHQYGESWILSGSVGVLGKIGVNNIICLQPFGCIANHVIAKGVQNRMKEENPALNILFLDTDAGTSEVNFYNRLHFFIERAKKQNPERV